MSVVLEVLPQVAEGVGGFGLFLYLLRTVLRSDKQTQRNISEVQKRLDAERVHGDQQDTEIDRLQEQLRAEREKAATAAAHEIGLRAELEWAEKRAERFAKDNEELRAEVHRLKGSGRS